MTAPRLTLAAVAGALLLATAASHGATTRPPGTIFRVRPDLRMCPSPLCGGYWVSRVNRSSMACGAGGFRTWCHVLEAKLPRGATSRRDRIILARGSIVDVGASEAGPVERLVATQAWVPATGVPVVGAVYLVTDTGRRCIRAPCFSLRAETVNTSRASTASALDLAGAAAEPALMRKAREAVTEGGLMVSGTIRRDGDGGRTIVATQFFLAAP